MLKQRVITAVLLLVVLVACLMAAEPWPFAALTLLLIAAAVWEWARLNRVHGVAMWGAVAAVVGGASWLSMHWGMPLFSLHLTDALHEMGISDGHVHSMDQPLAGFTVPVQVWWLVAAVWVLGSVGMLRWGLVKWANWPRFARLLLGALLLLAAWLAMMEAKHQGLNLLLSIMSLVWVADIGAYFAGRAFGKQKLAPAISPGKSWEGAVAGALATQCLAWAWVFFDQHVAVDSPSLYSHLLHGLGWAGMTAMVAGLAVMSVVGDLVESLVKRVAQVKDSSQLLPGHGGVLDRIDALLPVLPVSMAMLSFCHG
jgi:phosphatidate cytidylyltransferase